MSTCHSAKCIRHRRMRCLYHSPLANGKWQSLQGRRPPFGGKGGGERKGGEGGRDLPPGGPCAQRIPSPPSSPPLGPRNPTGNPSLCFFSSFSFSTFSAQPVISCAIVVRALSTFSFTLQRVASPTARIFKMLHSLR